MKRFSPCQYYWAGPEISTSYILKRFIASAYQDYQYLYDIQGWDRTDYILIDIRALSSEIIRELT